jgi:hypothetical protein
VTSQTGTGIECSPLDWTDLASGAISAVGPLKPSNPVDPRGYNSSDSSVKLLQVCSLVRCDLQCSAAGLPLTPCRKLRFLRSVRLIRSPLARTFTAKVESRREIGALHECVRASATGVVESERQSSVMESELAIGLLLFPKLTQLDLTGPYEVFARMPNTSVYPVADTLAPVRSEHGLVIGPTVTFADAPPFDILCVPGGPGVNLLMEDARTLSFL